MPQKRLTFRFFYPFLFVIGVAFIVIFGYVSSSLRQDSRREIENRYFARLQALSPSVIQALKKKDLEGLKKLVEGFESSPYTRLIVFKPGGTPWLEGEGTLPREFFRSAGLQAKQPTIPLGVFGQNKEGTPIFQALFPLFQDAENLGYLYLEANMTPEENRFKGFRNHFLLLLILSGAIILASAIAGFNGLSRSLENLRRGAERFADGDFSRRLHVQGSEEIEELASAMNRMAEELEGRFQTVLDQQKQMEAVFASMKEGVLAVRKDGTLLNMNEAAGHLLGVLPEAASNKQMEAVFRKPDLIAFIERAIDTDKPVEDEIRFYSEEGEDCFFNVHGTGLFDFHGEKIGVVVVLFDVTRLNRLENVRRDFVANVSHELRTPITSIKGFVETLLEGAWEDKENAQRFLEIVLRHVNRLNAIIEDLLALSRVERGAQMGVMEMTVEELRPVLRGAMEMCEHRAQEKEVRLILQCDKAIRLPMKAALLEQAMVNLLDNAIKYSESGSRVWLKVNEESENVVVAVQDEGCGIESRHLNRLFERFYRVDKARSRSLGGTGLGLAIVKHILLAHNGSIRVESRLGEGSTFYLHLPRQQALEIPEA